MALVEMGKVMINDESGSIIWAALLLLRILRGSNVDAIRGRGHDTVSWIE